jgi:hypothetical protein
VIVHEWLEQARDRLASSVGEEPATFDLSQADIDDLLKLAGVAAHESHERTNAPLLTYLVGLAHGRHPNRSLRGLADDAVGKST